MERLKRLYRWLKEKKAQSLVEYALIIALVAIVVITALTALRTRTNTTLQNVANQLPS